MTRAPLVLLVGRPNVGKSTLFNRLTRTRAALVDDREGVTRDWIERVWHLSEGLDVRLRDLCGFREHEDDPVLRQAQASMASAWNEADVILMVVDAREGITATDRWIAQAVRSTGRPVILVANKTDGREHMAQALTTAELGWEPVATSGEHGFGIHDLEDAVRALLTTAPAIAQPDPHVDISVAIVGRPNAGKSTLLNRLLGEARATVSDIPGTTRDPVDAIASFGNLTIRFVDTAGIRRKRSIDDQLEAASVSRSLKAIEDADIVLYLIRGDEGVKQQDQTVLARVGELGKGLIILLSQWDRIENREERQREIRSELERLLWFVEYAPVLTISAQTGAHVGRLSVWIEAIAAELDTEVPTAQLNDTVERVLRANPPPAVQIRQSRRSKQRQQLKIYYATQTGVRPMRILLFGNLRGIDLPPAYRRYLEKRLKQAFQLQYTRPIIEFRGKPKAAEPRGGKTLRKRR